ncbi:hypothetical protein Sango_3039300 [Sesamum angolense]|uniref:DUF4283 domain-containing protein n=1 Tax=Sesamum angolense TaxID=2727404 RepID=A0AAE1TAG6_9LAMI|nr:hypothetical protein Sango_3039300 [Sesamum angolense]
MLNTSSFNSPRKRISLGFGCDESGLSKASQCVFSSGILHSTHLKNRLWCLCGWNSLNSRRTSSRKMHFLLWPTWFTPLQLDDYTVNQATLTCAKVCIEVDLNRPLLEEFIINIRGVNLVQKVVYEQAPQYCKLCKHIGHQEKDCYVRGNAPKPAKPNLRHKAQARKRNIVQQNRGNSTTVPDVHKVFDNFPLQNAASIKEHVTINNDIASCSGTKADCGRGTTKNPCDGDPMGDDSNWTQTENAFMLLDKLTKEGEFVETPQSQPEDDQNTENELGDSESNQLVVTPLWLYRNV